jgi:hypothetical protein
MYILHEHKYIIAGLLREQREWPIRIVGKLLCKQIMDISVSQCGTTLLKSRFPIQILRKTGI